MLNIFTDLVRGLCGCLVRCNSVGCAYSLLCQSHIHKCGMIHKFAALCVEISNTLLQQQAAFFFVGFLRQVWYFHTISTDRFLVPTRCETIIKHTFRCLWICSVHATAQRRTRKRQQHIRVVDVTVVCSSVRITVHCTSLPTSLILYLNPSYSLRKQKRDAAIQRPRERERAAQCRGETFGSTIATTAVLPLLPLLRIRYVFLVRIRCGWLYAICI